ncbi:MAG: hypothetical protein QOE61_462 [Micromonosporaceae bacterium]|jgi:hypothetical protein|nr:hypothetical protein [Micromonosporaceae bacterium]
MTPNELTVGTTSREGWRRTDIRIWMRRVLV